MNLEIERKFLVQGDFRSNTSYSERIVQGFLCSVPERTTRIRIKGDKGFITVKGKGNDDGTTRFEWEKEISLNDAQQLLKLCEPGMIEKTRYYLPFGAHIFEVDVFEGENSGLVLAEVELQSADEQFQRPQWLGEEVTGDVRYYNSYMSKHPFQNW